MARNNDAEQVIEHGRGAVQDSLALGEDELPLGDDVVHSLHNGCPYAGLNRMAETAHAVGDLGVVLDEAETAWRERRREQGRWLARLRAAK